MTELKDWNDPTILMVGGALGLVALFAGRFSARWSLLGGRKNLPDPELVGIFGEQGTLVGSRQITILREIGRCYRVPYGKLRPGDRFKDGLRKVDSWCFGLGARQLETILGEDFDIDVALKESRISIAELLRKTQHAAAKGT